MAVLPSLRHPEAPPLMLDKYGWWLFVLLMGAAIFFSYWWLGHVFVLQVRIVP